MAEKISEINRVLNSVKTDKKFAKKIWFIRHGESTANAGGITIDHKTIPLSPLGLVQAQDIALYLPSAPTLIITSLFSRTEQTARPTMERFPSARHEVWNVHEFTHINPKKYNNATAAEQKVLRDEYWERCDPDYWDGEGTESFNDFLSRVKTAIDRVSGLDEEFVVMFTHAQFMRAIWALWDFGSEDTKSLMARFRNLTRFGNCEIIQWDENNYYYDINETCLEENLPVFLQHDLDAWREGIRTNSSVLDCLWCELVGSINSALVDHEITGKQATYLRGKYL